MRKFAAIRLNGQASAVVEVTRSMSANRQMPLESPQQLTEFGIAISATQFRASMPSTFGKVPMALPSSAFFISAWTKQGTNDLTHRQSLPDETPELRGSICQSDHTLADEFVGRKAQMRPGPGKEWCPMAKHDRAKVELVFVNQTQIGQALRQTGSCHVDLSDVAVLEIAHERADVILDEGGIGAD